MKAEIKSEARSSKQAARSRIIYIVLAVFVALSITGAIKKRYSGHPAERIQVYDLTWSEQGRGADGKAEMIEHKWRYFIEVRTSLPLKIEKYRRRGPDSEYNLEETLFISYPTTEQVRQAVAGMK